MGRIYKILLYFIGIIHVDSWILAKAKRFIFAMSTPQELQQHFIVSVT